MCLHYSLTQHPHGQAPQGDPHGVASFFIIGVHAGQHAHAWTTREMGTNTSSGSSHESPGHSTLPGSKSQVHSFKSLMTPTMLARG